MSLSEAMLELADEMENTLEERSAGQVIDAAYLATCVKLWSKAIRMTVKAAGDKPAVPFSPFDPRSDPASTKGVNPSDLAATQKALQRLQAKQQHMGDMAEVEEGLTDSMRLCVDGPEEGCHVSLHPSQQYVYVGGHCYTLKDDGKLHYQKLD